MRESVLHFYQVDPKDWVQVSRWGYQVPFTYWVTLVPLMLVLIRQYSLGFRAKLVEDFSSPCDISESSLAQAHKGGPSLPG